MFDHVFNSGGGVQVDYMISRFHAEGPFVVCCSMYILKPRGVAVARQIIICICFEIIFLFGHTFVTFKDSIHIIHKGHTFL